MEKIGRKGFELLRGLPQLSQYRIGIDLEHPRRAADAQPLRQTRDDPHDELHRGPLAVKDRAMGFREIALAGDALQLAPGLAAGMTVRADVAAAEPAVIRAIVLGTELPRGVDGASASPRDDEHWRWCARSFETSIEPLLTGLTRGFVDIAGEGLGSLARLRRALAGLNGLWDAGLREEGPQTCMRRQINTRATTRSCSNNTFGVMMASPFTTVKGDEFTRLTPAGIIRCLQVQDRYATHCEKSIDKKRGWRSRLLGLSSPAPTPTRSSPHGVRKLSKIDPLGQSLFTAARRPEALFVSAKSSRGAFFCGTPSALDQLGVSQEEAPGKETPRPTLTRACWNGGKARCGQLPSPR